MTWIVRLLLLALLLGGLAAFHHHGQNRPQRIANATASRTLLIGNGTDIQSLDPHLVTGQPEHWVITSLFEGLVAPAADNPDLDAPGLASAWRSDDFQTWTFDLRKDATWSDGTPITSADYLYSFQRILSPELGSHYAEMLHLMKGASAFHSGKTKDFSTVGVSAPDSHTLVITLEGPAPYFPGMLKHYTWFPVPRHVIERFGTMTTRDTPWARPGNIVSSGPFLLKEWRINHFIAVEKNPNYWDAATTQLNAIHFFPIDNPESEERVFLDGQLHFTYTVPLAKIPQYRQTKPSYFEQSPELACEFYRFNTTRAPFDNPKVRQAFALAIDRVALVDQVIRSGHLPATGLTPPGAHPDYKPLQVLSFDPTAARNLLAEAGYPGGKGFRKIEILTNTSATARTIAEFFQESWKKHLGIETTILQQEWQVYIDSQQSLNYDISRAGWVGDYADPYTFLGIWRTGDGNNNTGWGSPRYDELMLTATREPDTARRIAAMQEAETLLLTDLPIIPIFWRMNSHLIRPELKNWKHSVISHRCYKAIDLAPIKTSNQ
jgi:oligopeptide transport system substrate-binding protein